MNHKVTMLEALIAVENKIGKYDLWRRGDDIDIIPLNGKDFDLEPLADLLRPHEGWLLSMLTDLGSDIYEPTEVVP